MRVGIVLVGVLAFAMARADEVSWIHAGDRARFVCGAAPADWMQAAFDDRAWDEALPVPDGGMAIPDGGVGCTGTRYERWRFDVGAELARLATITLRIRYSHGFAAYLNGVEIARRRLDAGAGPAALANDWHGPEAERVIVPFRAGMLRPTGNTLAIEVHPRALGREPLVEAELSGADGPRLVRGPYLVNLSERAVTVLFDTDLPTVGAVAWGPTDEYGASDVEPSARTHHALTLRGLAADRAYHYRVTARSSPVALASSSAGLPESRDVVDSGDAAFHTPPGAGRPLRFVVYGDVRSGHDVHAALDRAILDDDPDFVLVTGDLVDRGSDEGDWEKFFEVGAPLLRRVATFPAVGNHEYARLGRGLPPYLGFFPPPPSAKTGETWYSFDAAGAHFVALDSNQYRSPAQLAWLDRDLAEARRRGARALFVYAHEAPYASGLHGDNQIAIHDYVPVFERHHVTLFLGGHDHHYERGRVGALDYVITGGGGAELRPQKCGVPGRKPCGPRVLALYNEHHYVLVEVMPTFARVCPKRPDGTPLEPCTTLPLRR